jgi:hypothetical protein
MSIKRINYDFLPLVEACEKMIASPSSISSINNLKREINKFFRDSTCVDVLYTKSDSVFFGMCVYPMMTKELVNAILQDADGKIRFENYIIEIDSKLFHPALDITPKELLAILLHEIGHIVNDPNPIEELRDAISISLAKSNSSINIPDSIHYSQILAFGFKSAIRKMNSMFFIYKNGEILADEFVLMCGFEDDLNSIFSKICRSGMKINDDVNKLVALQWSLSLYKNVKLKRIPAIRLLNKMEGITSSRIEKKEMEIVEVALKSIDDSSLHESCDLHNDNYYITENNKVRQTKYAELRKSATLKQIKKFEEDVYEYTMRIRHIATEEDALYLMRQINLRISVLEDFLDKERLTEFERDKWFALLEKYYSLRDNMSVSVKYRYDYSGSVIQVNYPDIVQDRM